MLVLSRQRDETIMIGDEIEITVVDIRGDKVRLGITAPTRIAVHRKEVYEAIRQENEQAARIAGGDLASLGGLIKPGPARSRVRCGGTVGTAGMGRAAGTPGASAGAEHDPPSRLINTVPHMAPNGAAKRA